MRYWVNIISQSHVQDGVGGGFTEADEGRQSRLRKLTKGDRLVFYSPRTERMAGQPVQKFTAIGEILDEEPYQSEAQAWRRRVRFLPAVEAPVQPLIDNLEFISNKKSWGVVFRRGFFEIGESDFRTIAAAMSAAA